MNNKDLLKDVCTGKLYLYRFIPGKLERNSQMRAQTKVGRQRECWRTEGRFEVGYSLIVNNEQYFFSYSLLLCLTQLQGTVSNSSDNNK
jgi:hypothetical protein